MLTASLSHFWQTHARDTVAPAPPRRRPAPIFIGDAVAPFGSETLLLSILRQDRAEDPPPDA